MVVSVTCEFSCSFNGDAVFSTSPCVRSVWAFARVLSYGDVTIVTGIDCMVNSKAFFAVLLVKRGLSVI